MTIAAPPFAEKTRPLSPAEAFVREFRHHPEVLSLKDSGLDFELTSSKKEARATLDSIRVEEEMRGNGYASSTLRILTELADRRGILLDLEVGFDEQGIGLVDWYRRHGFEWKENTMERPSALEKAYHVTTGDNLGAILRDGLAPAIGPRSLELGETSPAIYLFTGLEDVEQALSNWLGETFDEDEEIFVLEVNTRGLDVQHRAGQFEATLEEPVDARRIIRVLDENLRPVRKRSLQPS